MSYVHELYADRIGGSEFGTSTDIFKFERIKRAKKQAEIEQPDQYLIDLGIGESDDTADIEIIHALYENAKLWENRGYADNGITEFQEEAANYLRRVYRVTGYDAKTEILHVMGSKSALAMIPQAFINPGDVTLVTVPGYPIIGTMTNWLEGSVYKLPLEKNNAFLPDLDQIPEEICKKAKLLYLNYPNNPTGAVATKEFYLKVIDFARRNHIIVVQDAAYGAIVFAQQEPLSILSIEGSKEVAIEIHSLSKAFSMTGWRLGFVVGDQRIIRAIATVKDNNDSGQFRAIQRAGIYALSHPEITKRCCEKLLRRHLELNEVLSDCGFEVTTPRATFYQYVKIPKRTKSGVIFHTAEDFTTYLIKTAKISTVPWDDVGNYFRVSATYVADDMEREKAVMKELHKRLLQCEFIF